MIEKPEFRMPLVVYVVRSSEGTGLPPRLRDMPIEEVRRICVKDWREAKGASNE